MLCHNYGLEVNVLKYLSSVLKNKNSGPKNHKKFTKNLKTSL